MRNPILLKWVKVDIISGSIETLLLQLCGGFCDGVLCVLSSLALSSLAMISLRKRGASSVLIVFKLVCFVCVLLSLPHCAMVWSVIVAFPGHSQSIIYYNEFLLFNNQIA